MFTPKTLGQIDLRNSPQVRSKVRDDVVSDYMQNYQTKVPMPEPVLFQVGENSYLIADGLHRITAMRGLGADYKGGWVCQVFKGDYEDCLREALKCNIQHGLRRSPEDKEAAVTSALVKFNDLSDRQIAEIASVGHTFVAKVRKEIRETPLMVVKPAKTKGKDGKLRSTKPRSTGIDSSSNDENKGKTKDSGAVPPEPASLGDGFKAPLVDAIGCPVPAKALKYWDRQGEVKGLLKSLSEIKCIVEKAVKDDLMFIEVNNSTLALMGTVRDGIKLALPYAVCPTCNGQLVEKCTLCRGRGVVSEFRYNTVPLEIRKLREKLHKKNL